MLLFITISASHYSHLCVRFNAGSILPTFQYLLRIDQFYFPSRHSLPTLLQVHRAIDALGERQLTVDPQALCPLSGKRVFDGPFYVFPSGYACAQQPLIAHVTPHLPPHKQRRVRDLCARLGYPPPPRSMLPNGLKLNPNTSSTSAKQQQEALLEKEVREEAKEQERLEALRAGPGASLSASEREAFQTQLDDMVSAYAWPCVRQVRNVCTVRCDLIFRVDTPLSFLDSSPCFVLLFPSGVIVLFDAGGRRMPLDRHTCHRNG